MLRTFKKFNFKLVEKMNPMDHSKPKLFYAISSNNGKIGLRDVSNMISENCSLKNADVLAVLESLVEVVSDQLSQGKTVYLGDFGTFTPSIKSEGVETSEKFSQRNILKVKVNFRQGLEFKRRLALINFSKIS